jgi:hypothetical protein
MPWEEKAALFRKALQAGPVEATIKAFQSRLTACIDVAGQRFKLPRRWRRADRIMARARPMQRLLAARGASEPQTRTLYAQ